MQKVQFILSTIFLVAAAKVLALSPQIGFGWHPHYNYTNNTNGSHHNPQYPSNRNHCMYQNIPEPGSHSVYVGCVNYTDRLLYSQVCILLNKNLNIQHLLRHQIKKKSFYITLRYMQKDLFGLKEEKK